MHDRDPDAFLQHGAAALPELHRTGIVPGVLKRRRSTP
jgi:hypothetical protein